MNRGSARVTRTELQGCTLISVEGEINQAFEPASIGGRLGVVVFDLGGVRRITSHGVLQWITGLKGLESTYYCFVNCRPCAMDQFNLVNAFPQRGELVTFFAVFSCPECTHEVDQLIDLRHDFEMVGSSGLPDVDCPKCGARTEFDEVPELYFKYVQSASPPHPPQAAAAAIGGAPSVGRRARRFELKKDIDGSITAFWMRGHLDQGAYLKRVADGVDGPAIIEMSELEGISEDAEDGFIKFLKQLGEDAMIARVPAGLIDTLTRLLDKRAARRARVLSFLVPLRCTGCRTAFAADVPGDRLEGTVGGSRAAEVCSRCMHPLEPQWTKEMAAAAVKLPLAPAAPEVQTYLRANPPTGRIVGGDPLASRDPAHLLLDKYQVLRPIARGGMGEVFLARQVGEGSAERLVVLKRIRRDRIGDRQARELFLQEARIAARLSHPNIVKIFDLERVDDEYLISMEYVNGIDLGRALHLSRVFKLTWPIEICCRVLADLCGALHAAHSNLDEAGNPSPIVHRDVSPGNILLSTDGEVKLADFGIARAEGDLSEAEVAQGKAGYAAPEQGPGSTTPIDQRTDIYAAGVVLFECVTLRSIPGTPREATSQPMTTPLPGSRPMKTPQIVVARSGAPPLLQNVFERCIQPEPDQRYSSARDLARDLERIGRLVAETTFQDLSAWVRRLVSLRLEADGQDASPLVTMNTGSPVESGPFRLFDQADLRRK